MIEFFIGLLIGIFLTANLSPLRRFFSFEEFYWGIIKGLGMGEQWKKNRSDKKEDNKKE